jgi:hypothetical protein
LAKPAPRFFAPYEKVQGRQLDELLGRQFALLESINRNPIAERARLLPFWIGERGNRGVKPFPIAAESQPDKISLRGVQFKSRVGEIL